MMGSPDPAASMYTRDDDDDGDDDDTERVIGRVSETQSANNRFA